jgi:recombination protein RecA
MAAKKTDARAERISKICGNINKGDWGGEDKHAVTWLGSRDAVTLKRWTSGCPSLDDALGGGWPKGRFIEIYGPESGGKTTAVLHAIAEHQKAFPEEDVALIDSEYSFDEEYAQSIGVDTRYLIVHQPEDGKQALNILEELIKAGIGLAVVDSVAALTTKEDMAGDIGDTQVGGQARLMSQGLRRLNVEAGRRQTTIFFTNQVRDKIGVSYGSPETTPAGRALKHYASIRCRFSRIGNIKEGEVIVSAKTRADVKKNKVAPPFRRAEFCITFGIGIDIVAAILDDAIAAKVVEKRGSWLSFDGEQIGQGRAFALDLMRTDAGMTETIRLALEESKQDAEDKKAEKKAVKAEKKTSSADIKRPKSAKKKPDVEDPDGIDTPAVEVEDV